MYVIDIYISARSSRALCYSDTEDRVIRLFGVSSVLISYSLRTTKSRLQKNVFVNVFVSSSVYSLFNAAQHILLLSRLSIHQWIDTLLAPGRCPSREMFITLTPIIMKERYKVGRHDPKEIPSPLRREMAWHLLKE